MSQRAYPNRLQGRNIRLLELLPGAANEPLDCHLVETPLETAPSFEALSYVWGDSSVTETISCNGQIMEITVNLARALRRLRAPPIDSKKGKERQSDSVGRLVADNDTRNGVTMTLWADAVCINQQDVLERSSQVQLMGNIYSGALRVVVWLGDDPEGHARTAVATMKKICDYLDAYQQVVDTMRTAGTAPPWMKGRGHLTFDMCVEALKSHGIEDPWTALQSLYRVEWWTRVWCVQEVFLAQQVRLLFGTEEVDGTVLGKFTEWYFRENFFGKFNASDTKEPSALGKSFIFEALNAFRHKIMNGKDLCLVCEDFRSRRATNPRDKVYGILGLWRPRSPNLSIVVDYAKSTANVYTDVVLQAIEERKDLFVLRMVDHKTDYSYNEGDEFPSWVPRWDDEERQPFAWLDKSPIRACRYLADTPDRDLALAGVLHIKGHVFDQIAWVSDELEQGVSTFYTNVAFRETVIQFYKEAVDMTVSSAYTHRVTVVELATALTSGMIKIGQEFLDNDQVDPNAWLDISDIDTDTGRKFIKSFQTFMDTDNHPGDTSVFPRFLDILAGRRLIRTKRGHVGLARRNTRAGDFVTVLHGGWVPCVLRMNKEIDAFNFVGDSFVYDIMDGQIYDSTEELCKEGGVFMIR